MNILFCKFIAIFFLLFCPTVLAQENGSISEIKRDRVVFLDNIQIVAQKILNTNMIRRSKLKAINDSYELTQEALQQIKFNNLTEAKKRLLLAHKKSKENRIALLFLAALAEESANTEDALQYFEKFYHQSFFPVKAEANFVNERILASLRDFARTFLESHGITIKKTKIPGHVQFLKSMNRLDVFPEQSFFGTILTVTVMCGLGILLFLNMLNSHSSDFWKRRSVRFILQCYYGLLAGYLYWMSNLFTGWLPISTWTAVKHVKAILFLTFALALLLLFLDKIKSILAIKRDPHHKLCSKCWKPIMKIQKVCPHCGKDNI